MLDFVAVVSILITFGLGLAYVRGCDRLEAGASMILNIVLLLVSALLMGYLVYALLRPEKF